ncbi:MAG: Clp protease N-terminal domain-containing protein, partial [Candidatus Dormibacteraeota bacterium]|nr:Clp protease N-terminal domain-containing protein [Candidatus Dormibacteraeota bacterium]
AIARQESKALRQSFVGLDHLALALAHPDCPGASRRVLASFGVVYDDLRSSYAPAAPLHGEVRHGRELTTELLLTLERANWWALRLEDGTVTSEHLLLALGDRWQQSQLTDYMATRGLDPESIWVRVIALTEGCFHRPDGPIDQRDVA